MTVRRGSLYDEVPSGRLTEERFDTLLDSGPVTIERIVSTGQTAPGDGWFDQPQDEWVCLIQGAARLEIENGEGETVLAPGDWVFLPAHCRHRVTWTQTKPPTLWLAVHIRAP